MMKRSLKIPSRLLFLYFSKKKASKPYKPFCNGVIISHVYFKMKMQVLQCFLKPFNSKYKEANRKNLHCIIIWLLATRNSNSLSLRLKCDFKKTFIPSCSSSAWKSTKWAIKASHYIVVGIVKLWWNLFCLWESILILPNCMI